MVASSRRDCAIPSGLGVLYQEFPCFEGLAQMAQMVRNQVIEEFAFGLTSKEIEFRIEQGQGMTMTTTWPSPRFRC